MVRIFLKGLELLPGHLLILVHNLDRQIRMFFMILRNMFLLLPQIVDIVILFNPLVGGLAVTDQVEMVIDEDEECDAHDGAHYDDEEEESLHHEQVLEG